MREDFVRGGVICVCYSMPIVCVSFNFVAYFMPTPSTARTPYMYSVHKITQIWERVGLRRARSRVCVFTIYFYYLHKSESSHTHTDRHGLKRSGLEGRGMVWG